jgi:hypothetical protein
MVSHGIIAFVFRIINFSLLIMALVYIYKKYIRETLVRGVHRESTILNDLVLQKKNMHTQWLVVEKQLGDDQQLIIELRKKLFIWVHKQEVWHQERAAYKKNFINALQDQLHSKQTRIAEYMLKKESMPMIIAQAKQDLIKK